eukprot:COSAG01_NODE_817_length_13376_cov_2.970101_14_plen_148_part_00
MADTAVLSASCLHASAYRIRRLATPLAYFGVFGVFPATASMPSLKAVALAALLVGAVAQLPPQCMQLLSTKAYDHAFKKGGVCCPPGGDVCNLPDGTWPCPAACAKLWLPFWTQCGAGFSAMAKSPSDLKDLAGMRQFDLTCGGAGH